MAKTAITGADTSATVIKVLRGTSTRPLYITAAGVDASVAAAWVAGMAETSRIPDLLAAVDRLSRST